MSTELIKLKNLEMDEFKTQNGHSVKIYFIEHASLVFDIDGYIMYSDPVTAYGDLSGLPKADLIIFTHNHYDHFDLKAIEQIRKNDTEIIGNKDVIDDLKKANNTLPAHFLDYKQKLSKNLLTIEALPAHNTTNIQFHPSDRDNAYLLTIDGMTFYIPGDCEDMPELADYKNIDVVFLPVNQPYTMTIDQAVHAIKMMQPKIFYPIHYGDTDIPALVEKMKAFKTVETRIRRMP